MNERTKENIQIVATIAGVTLLTAVVTAVVFGGIAYLGGEFE